MQTTKYYEKPVEIFEKDLAENNRFMISFLHNISKGEEYSGLLSVEILNVNNIPTRIELNRATFDGNSIKGYITAKYNHLFEDGMVKV